MDEFFEDVRDIGFYDTGERGTLKLTRAGCGHKIVVGSEPRHRHCSLCWFAFFTIHGEVTKLADELFREDGEAALVQIKGRNFVTHFTHYMAALEQWKQLQEKNEQGTTGLESGSKAGEAGPESGEANSESGFKHPELDPGF